MVNMGGEDARAKMIRASTMTAFRKHLHSSARVDASLFAPSNLDIRTMYDIQSNLVAATWTLYLLGCKTWTHVEKTVEYPATWWDAFKERWFPAWSRRWFPIHHTKVECRVEHWHVCPHMDTPQAADHITFLTSGA